ncbi:MAG: hypothetical protein V1859_02520 [archaeon]
MIQMPEKIKSDPFSTMFQNTPSEEKPTTTSKAKATPKAEEKQAPAIVSNMPVPKDLQFQLQTLSMDKPMIDWLDEQAYAVKKATNFKKANRSSIARYAISKIQEKGIDHDELVDFIKKEQGLM